MLNYTLGKSFPPATVFAGYVVFVLGIALLFVNPMVALVISAFGGFMAFTTTNIKLNPITKTYKNYNRCLGLIIGKWQSYEAYPHLTVLRKNISTSAYSRANTPTQTNSKTYFAIYLLNTSHRQKILIKRLNTKEEAQQEVKILATQLGVETVAYRPMVSAKTKSRRRWT